MFPRYVVPEKSLDENNPLAMWEAREVTSAGVSDEIIRVPLGNYENTSDFPIEYGQVLERVA